MQPLPHHATGLVMKVAVATNVDKWTTKPANDSLSRLRRFSALRVSRITQAGIEAQRFAIGLLTASAP